MRKRILSVVFSLMVCFVILQTPSVRAESVVGELDTPPKLITTESVWYGQSQMGNAVGDAMRAMTGADVALLNNGDLIGSLGQGTITEADVRGIFSEDRLLAVAEITPAELFMLLEQSVSQVTLDTTTERLIEEESQYAGFCQVSGLTFTYDVSAPVGERITKLKLQDGRTLDREDTETALTLCATETMLSGGYGFPTVSCTVLNTTLTEALSAYLAENRVFPDITEERITVIGCREKRIAGNVSRGGILAAAAVLILLVYFSTNRWKRYREETEEKTELNPYE